MERAQLTKKEMFDSFCVFLCVCVCNIGACGHYKTDDEHNLI